LISNRQYSKKVAMLGNAQARRLATAVTLFLTPLAVADARENETPGVIVETLYQGEIFSDLRGGASEGSGAHYLGLLDIVAIAETEKLGLWPGGRLLLYAQDGHGRSITESHVGDLQTLSNIDAGDFTQISEVWYEQAFFRGGFRLKVGKQDANADFGASDYTGNFLNSSFGLIPTVAIPTYPEGAPGAAAFVRPVRGVQAGIGAYHAAGDPIGVGELQWRPGWFGGRNPGAYRIGYWRIQAKHEEVLPEEDPRVFAANHGAYLHIDQWVLGERAVRGEPQGLAFSAQFGWAPGDRNEVSRYLGGALTYSGLIPGRNADVTGLGVARAGFCNRVQTQESRGAETAMELFYRFQAADWFALQTDAQYILSPNGDCPDALALGLRFELGYGFPIF
jgi:porin